MTRVFPWVAVAICVGAMLMLTWRAWPVQALALKAGELCYPKVHSTDEMLCTVILGMAVNMVTSRVPEGRLLLKGAEKLCSENPRICLWLTGVVAYQVLPINPGGMQPDLKILSPVGPGSTTYSPKVYQWKLPQNDISSFCEDNTEVCGFNTQVDGKIGVHHL